jgi:predicted ATPase
VTRPGATRFFRRETWRDVIDRSGAVSRRPLVESAPVSIRETLQRRLSGLAAGEREVLEAAAVLGEGGDVRALITACQGEAGEVLSALDTAARFGFLATEELARRRVGFPHALTRQAVLDLVNPSRRMLLHARIGDVLQSAGTDSPQVVLQLAYHYAMASALGYGGRAAEYLVLSAREAERSLAFEDAAAWYSQGADLCEGSEREREEIRFAAARCHVRAGDFASAMDMCQRLSASRDPRMRLRAAIGYEDAAARPGLPGAHACALLTRALDDVPADPDDSEYVRALASLGRAMALTGAADKARALGEQALEYAGRIGDEQLILHALRAMMIHAREPESLGTCLAIATEVARLARECEDWDGLGESATFRSAIAYLNADPVAWADGLADLDLAGRKTGQPLGRYLRGCNDYAQAFLRGDFAAAERTAEDLLEIGRSFGPGGSLLTCP